MRKTDAPTLHIHFVLDRSGSMAAIADDVIGGFNAFIERQRREGHPARMTLVQFDSQGPFDRLLDAVPLEEVPPLDGTRFLPRGATPLYDAMGRALAEARARELQRESEGLSPEDVLFVTLTDGLENASREYTQASVFQAVKDHEQRGWSFVYLGANQDAYQAGYDLGVDPRSVQNFVADRGGVMAAFESLSDSTTRLSRKIAEGRRFDRRDFFEGAKAAELDFEARGRRARERALERVRERAEERARRRRDKSDES